MKYFIYFIAVVFLFGLNIGLFSHFNVSGQLPNFLFLFTLFSALEKKDMDFFFLAFLSGLFLDFFSTSFFGSYTLTFLILSFFTHYFFSHILVININWKTMTFVLIVGIILENLFLWFYGFLAFKFGWTEDYNFLAAYFSNFIVSIIYNGVLVYPVFLYFNFVRIVVVKIGRASCWERV